MNTIWSDFARMIYNVEVEVEGENGHGDSLAPAASSSTGGASFSYSGGTPDDQPNAYSGEGFEGDEVYAEPTVVQQRIVDENEQIGRNDPCWCGSGKKFKKCHGA
jgi:preprotein translocase subunit SecA